MSRKTGRPRTFEKPALLSFKVEKEEHELLTRYNHFLLSTSKYNEGSQLRSLIMKGFWLYVEEDKKGFENFLKQLDPETRERLDPLIKK